MAADKPKMKCGRAPAPSTAPMADPKMEDNSGRDELITGKEKGATQQRSNAGRPGSSRFDSKFVGALPDVLSRVTEPSGIPPGHRISVRMPDGTPVPVGLTIEDGNPLRVWVVCDGYEPRALPAPGSPFASGGKPLRFLETVNFSSRTEGGDSSYYLLARTVPAGRTASEVIGWVDERYLLRNPHALIDAQTRYPFRALILPAASDPPPEEGRSSASRPSRPPNRTLRPFR